MPHAEPVRTSPEFDFVPLRLGVSWNSRSIRATNVEMTALFGLVLLFSIQSAFLGREPYHISESFLRSRVVRSDCLVYPWLTPRAKVPGFLAKVEVVFDGKSVRRVEIVRRHPLLDKAVQTFVQSWKFQALDEEGLLKTRVHVYFDFTGRWGIDESALLVLGGGSFVVEKRREERGPVGCQRWVGRKEILRVLTKRDRRSAPLGLAFVRDDQGLIDLHGPVLPGGGFREAEGGLRWKFWRSREDAKVKVGCKKGRGHGAHAVISRSAHSWMGGQARKTLWSRAPACRSALYARCDGSTMDDLAARIEALSEEMAAIPRGKTGAERLGIAGRMCSGARLMLLCPLRSIHPDWERTSDGT